MNQPIDIPDDITEAGPNVVAAYCNMVAQNTSPRLAEMLALRQAPRCMTDSVFFSSVGTLDKQFGNDTESLNRTVSIAKKHGYTPNPNDYYNASLANFVGDPKAFIPATGGRGHIQKVCEERGTACSGAVTVKARQPDSDPLDNPKCKLNPRIVNRKVNQMIANNPVLAHKNRRDLVSRVVEKHGKQS